MQRMTTRFAALGMTALLALGAAAPLAQAEQQTGQNSATTQQQAQDIPDAKVKAFAQAAQQVSEIAREWQPKVKQARQAGETEKAQKAMKQANTEIRAAIEQQDDLTLDEYKRIGSQARQNEQLAARIQQEMNGGQSGGAGNDG